MPADGVADLKDINMAATKAVAEAIVSREEFGQTIEKAKEMAFQKLGEAGDLPEFMLVNFAYANLDPKDLEWARNDAGGMTPDAWLKEFTDEKDREKISKEATRCANLLARVSEKTVEGGQTITMGIDFDQENGYRLMTVFPAGIAVEPYEITSQDKLKREIVYMRLGSGCCQAAAENLLAGERTKVLTTKALNASQLTDEIHFDFLSPVVEFDPKKYAPDLYLLWAAFGMFTGEGSRYKVSGFSGISGLLK